MVVANLLIEHRRDHVRDQDLVDRLDHGRGRAAVDIEIHARRAVAQQLVSRIHVRRDVRAAKTIDRLLRIANDREPARGLVHPHGAEDVPLHRVGVLELVDHHPWRPRAQPLSELGSARSVQRIAHELQHVVVVEQPVLRLIRADPRDHVRQHHGRHRLVERGHRERALEDFGDRRQLRHFHDTRVQLHAGVALAALADRVAHREHTRRGAIPLLDDTANVRDPLRSVILVRAFEREPFEQSLATHTRAEHDAETLAELERRFRRVHAPRRRIFARACE